MILANLIPLLVVALVVWFVASRRRSGRRAAAGFASDDTIPYPVRQLDAGRSLRFGAAGSAGRTPQPLRWVISGLVVVLLVLATLDFVLRVTVPMAGWFGLGYLAVLLMAGVFLPALRLPAFGLGQPRAPDGKAPRGTGTLTVVLLALLTFGAVWRAVRAMEVHVFDLRMPEDTADIVFAGLLVVALIAVVLRLLASRDSPSP